MSYEFLTLIVIANALVTFALWRSMRGKADRPEGLNKKAAKRLWDGEAIVPKHNPPEQPGGELHALADATEWSFFADFIEFADVVNWWLADEYVNSRWRLQALPDGDRSINVDFDHGPMLGRCYALFYNQVETGRLEIADATGYTSENPTLYTNIEIRNVRLLGYDDVTGILQAIALHVVSANSESVEYRQAMQSINSALTEVLWNNYRISKYSGELDRLDWGELTVRFDGTASWYMARRQGWRQTMAEKAGTAVVKTAMTAKAAEEANRGRNEGGIAAGRARGILIGAAIGVAISVASAAFNSTFSGADWSAEWIAHNIGYFAPWALVGGVIGFFSTKKKQQP